MTKIKIEILWVSWSGAWSTSLLGHFSVSLKKTTIPMSYLSISHTDITPTIPTSRNKTLSADSHTEFTFQAGNLTFLNLSIYCCNTFFFSNNYLLMKTPLNKCILRILNILNTLKNGTIWVCCPPWAAEGTNRCGTVFTGGCLHMHTSVTLSNPKKKSTMHTSNISCVKKKNIHTQANVIHQGQA